MKSQLATEKVSNLEFDVAHKETLHKCEDIENQLSHALDQNQQLLHIKSQLQGHISELEQQNRIFQSQITKYQLQVKQLQQQLSSNSEFNPNPNPNPHPNNPNMSDNNANDEFSGKFDNVYKFGSETASDDENVELSEENKDMRRQLLDTQMEHEELKKTHRQSVSQIEAYELQQAMANANDMANEDRERLQREVETLNERLAQMEIELKKEKRKNESLDKERRNSLAQLSQNMFKKLLDSEHQHYDNTSTLEAECQELKAQVELLVEAKVELAKSAGQAIDQLRTIVHLLGRQLAKYEK